MLFPEVDPNYVLTKLEAFQDYPSPMNEICIHLLENSNYPRAKKQEAPAKPVEKKSQVGISCPAKQMTTTF